MKVLGLSANYHDASAALVLDGAVAAAAAEERFTLQKHDPSFPRYSALFCLEQAGIEADDLDLVAYYEEPEVRFSRTLTHAFTNFPFSGRAFRKSMKEAVISGFWVKNEISKALDIDPAKIVFVPHHSSHAAHAFLSSPFATAAVLTADTVGEWTCTGLFRGDAAAKGGIAPVGLVPFPHSLGLVYSAFTSFLGFKVNDGECSTMALAAFGEPRYAPRVREIIRVKPDGSYEIDASYFDLCHSGEKAPLTEKFRAAFGDPRPFEETLPFDCLSDGGPPADPGAQRFADVAASIQLVLEESLIALAKKAARVTGEKDLCLAGGVALNCVANGKLAREGIFENIFVPPDPGDGGGAMGAALYASTVGSGKRNGNFVLHPYLGKSFAEDDVIEMLAHLDEAKGARVAVRSDFDSVLAMVVPALAGGKVVGWVQGRFENGPRALGNRSLLCHPGRLDAARRIGAGMKKRETFRPYACSLADFEAERLLGAAGADALPRRWMLSSATVRPELRSTLRASLHVDGSTRPQICTESDNPRFYRLLKEFGAQVGVAALLNTSLNERGMPMASGPAEALLMFLRTDMDMLVLNNSLVAKDL